MHAQDNSPKREFRAAWVTTAWGLDWPKTKVTSDATRTQQQNELKAIIDKLQAANFNAVCFQVRSFSDAMYESSYEPWNYSLTGTRGGDPGYDPLEFAIEYAHSLGMELHAWINPYRYSSASATYGSGENDYATTNSGWLMHSKNDQYVTILNPGIPAVRQRIADVVAEIVTNYDVDGVMFDDYFYLNSGDAHGGTKDEEDATLYANNNPNSLSLADWRRDQVNQMVELVYSTIKGIKPACRFGISPAGVACTAQTVADKYGVERCTAPAGDWQYDGIYSDPLAWLYNHDIDYISPQIYWQIGHSTADYNLLCNWWSKVANQFGRHFYSSHTLSSLGEGEGKLGDGEFVNQIALNREYTQNTAPGSIFYSIRTGLNSSTFLNSIKSNSFTQQSLPPAMDWKAVGNAEQLNVAPGLAFDENTQILSWTHDVAERFTVYAYEKGMTKSAALGRADNLVRVVYGKSIDLTGIVTDFENTTLAVRAYDRYGNEYEAGTYNEAEVEQSWIAVDPQKVELSGEQDKTLSQHVTVESDKLSEVVISTTSSSTACTINVTKDWDENTTNTAGTLRISVKATTAGVYEGTVTLTLEDVTKTVTIAATIKSKSTALPGHVAGITHLGNRTFTGTGVRSIVYDKDYLYLANQGDGNLYKVAAPKSTFTSSALSLSNGVPLNLASDFAAFNLCITNDGQLLSGNNYADSKIPTTTPIYVYTVDKGNGGATLLGSYSCNSRTDYFDVYGDWNGTGYIVSFSQGDKDNSVAPVATYIPFSNGILQTSQLKTFGAVNLGTAEYPSNGIVSRVLAHDATSFYIQQKGYAPKKYNITTETLTDVFPSGISPTIESNNATGMGLFTVAGHKYLITPVNRFGSFEIYEVTTEGQVTNKVINKTANIGNNANSTVTVDFATYVDGYDAYIYVLVPNNGIAAYKFTFAPDPSLTSSVGSTEQTWNVTQGQTVAHRDIEITGVALSSDITVSCSNPAVTVSKLPGWDARKGGFLRLQVDTDWAVGTYDQDITLTSGSVTCTVKLKATIKAGAPAQTGFVAPASSTHSLTQIWAKKDAEVDYISGNHVNRSMAYYDGKLYISNSNGTYNTDAAVFYVVNANTGAQEGSRRYPNFTIQELSWGGILSTHGNERHNIRITDDGTLLIGNTIAAGNIPIAVYKSDRNSGGGSQLTPTISINGRSDFFYTYGTYQNGFLLAFSNTGNQVIKVNLSNGIGTISTISITGLSSAVSAKAIPAPDGNSFYATIENNFPIEYNFNGSQRSRFATNPSYEKTYHHVSGLGVFILHGRRYMVLPANDFGKFHLYDITGGLNTAKLLYTMNPNLGTVENGAATIDFCVHTEGDNAYIYVLAPNNGVAAYKFTLKPTYIFEGNEQRGYNWHTPANWSMGQFPGQDDNVLIKSDCVVEGGAGYAQKIDVVAGKTLTIAPTGVLTVQEDICQIAAADATTRETMSAEKLIIKADATDQGVLAYFKNTSTNAKVEIYGGHTVNPDETGGDNPVHIPWEYVAMPFDVTNAEKTEFFGSWITAWNEAKGTWEFQSGNDVNLVPWTGYAVIQEYPKTYRLTGTLQAPIAKTITLSATRETSANQKNKGAHFIGNSWTAPLNLSGFTSDAFTNVNKTIYLHENLFNKEGTALVAERYEAISLDNLAAYADDDIPLVINPLQGFFVKATGAGAASVTLDYTKLVTKTTRQPGQNTYRMQAKQPTEDAPPLKITVTADDGLSAKVFLFASERYTAAFDDGLDAHKLRDSKNVPYLAAASAAGDMAILATPDLHGTYLNFESGSGTSYTLRFSYRGEDRLYLVDAVTGISTEIRSGGTYSFSPTADDHYRFRISRKTMEEGALEGMELWAYGRQLYFTNTFGAPTDICVYGVDGRLVEHSVTQDKQYLLSVPAAGVYVVQVSNEEGRQTIRVIL